ncbi:ribokinase [Domibacillus iocasae]|uniref:Ribokinase n=1 Tax=Domibacillus iocasae TaxID=1714016 RepID=A0A1E7DTG3_9BACI|nr:ribokinase [Domibacillus iocasae]OES46351.1 ribokinase [Domibacillus iocasae]
MGQVTVIGSYVVDLMSRTPHLPVPGETVLGGPFQMGPGGKGGNQATAAARSGSDVTFVTKIGLDVFGEEAMRHFEREGFNVQFIKRSETDATGTALIAVDDRGENNIVIAPGACGTMKRLDVIEAETAIKKADILLIQLEISLEAIKAAIEQASIHRVPVLLNPAPYLPFPSDWLQHVTYATPNETEARGLTGVDVVDESSAQKAANFLHEKGVRVVIITLGEKGVYVSDGTSRGKFIEGFSVKAVDTTGAGDAFNGGFAHAVSSGMPVEEAVQFGQAVAALSVTKIGTAASMPSIEEIKAFLKS